jgi:hypothetical protein
MNIENTVTESMDELNIIDSLVAQVRGIIIESECGMIIKSS